MLEGRDRDEQKHQGSRQGEIRKRRQGGARRLQGVLLRFRLRRAIDLCRQVDQDLDGYPLGANQRELLELRQLTHYLMLRLTKVARGTG